MNEELRAVICPYCGLVFRGSTRWTFLVCPHCGQMLEIEGSKLLEAQLASEQHG